MMKLTFKKWKRETGLAGVGYTKQSVDIKHKKLVIGTIKAPNWSTEDNKYGIAITVKDYSGENPNCDWKWIGLKARFDEEDEARAYLKENLEGILERNNLELHYSEPYND